MTDKDWIITLAVIILLSSVAGVAFYAGYMKAESTVVRYCLYTGSYVSSEDSMVISCKVS